MSAGRATLRIVRRESAASAHGWPTSVHPVLRRVYALRGVTGPDGLGHRLAGILPPDGIADIAVAAALLHETMERNGRIVIAGDYDCDGATGCAVRCAVCACWVHATSATWCRTAPSTATD